MCYCVHGLMSVLLCACVSVYVSCECVFGYMYIICMYMYIIYMGVHVCVCIRVYVRVSSWVGLLLQHSDLFGEIRTCYRRLWSAFADEPIHWRFENWPMGCSRDSYQFMQWRPDGEPIPESRHFMWVFVIGLFQFQCFYLIVSCECIYYSALFSSCRQLLLYHDALILFYGYIITLLPTLLLFCSGILS